MSETVCLYQNEAVLLKKAVQVLFDLKMCNSGKFYVLLQSTCVLQFAKQLGISKIIN